MEIFLRIRQRVLQRGAAQLLDPDLSARLPRRAAASRDFFCGGHRPARHPPSALRRDDFRFRRRDLVLHTRIRGRHHRARHDDAPGPRSDSARRAAARPEGRNDLPAAALLPHLRVHHAAADAPRPDRRYDSRRCCPHAMSCRAGRRRLLFSARPRLSH